MKKIKQGILLLLLVGAFLLATQISCQKTVAQNNNTNSPANLILYGKSIPVFGQNVDSSGNPIRIGLSYDFYLANIDGTNPKKIPIAHGPNLLITQGGYLTPDGRTIIFTAHNQAGTLRSIYSCLTDGSNLKKLMDIDNSTQLLGAY